MNHKGTVALETERLILRRFTMDDVTDAYNNWLSDPDVAMYMQWDAHTDVKQTHDWVAGYYVTNYDKDSFYRWAIALKEDKKAIGSVGFNIEKEYDSVADVSYTLCKRFWNKGIMSEALTAVVEFAFDEVKINRLEAFHAAANPSSGRVLQKAGMKYEGHARQKYRNRLRGFEDCDMYAIIADDYFKEKTSTSSTKLKKNNIIIAGVPRAGKTTLCRMLMRHRYTHISMDAIIAGFEKCYPETGINTYQDLSSMETMCAISRKIAPFIRAMIESEYSGYEGERAVFDVYQLLPEDYIKHLASLNCTVHWIGSSDCTEDERFNVLKANDTERHYTFYKSENELREGCGYIVEQSRLLKQECEKYGLMYSDTTYNRETILNEILSNILEVCAI